MDIKTSYKFLMLKPVYLQMINRMVKEADIGDHRSMENVALLFNRQIFTQLEVPHPLRSRYRLPISHIDAIKHVNFRPFYLRQLEDFSN